MRSSPIQVGSGSYKIVALGNNSTMAIDPYGTLTAWGENLYGQAGTNSITSYSWTQLRNGDAHSLALRSDSTLWAWGFNGQGQLGTNDTVNRQSPTQISGSWASVSAGSSHTLGIKSDNTLWAWGTNGSGSVGDGTIISRSSPVQIDTSAWTSISAGLNFSMAIKTADKSLWTWGLNTSYQLASNTTVARSVPAQVGISSWSLISAGGTHALAIDINNKLYGWGTQTSGQLGLGDTALRSQPTQIGASSWVAISAGYSHSMALTSDNQLFTWGINANGQLGFNRSFISLNAGLLTSSVVRTDGTLWAWGRNDYGQLGDGTAVVKSSPVAVGLLTNWSNVTKSTLNSFAIKTNGTLWGWGENSSGTIGDSTTLNKSSPVQIGASTWITVATGGTATAGQQAAYAITSDGKLYTWGNNVSGQLGDTTVVPRSSPVQLGTSSWSVVSAGNQFVMAITSEGALFGWGKNSTGQLGITPSTFSWTTVNSSGLHTLAIRSDNKLFAWGLNSSGQLGLGDTAPRSSPVQVASGSYIQISAGLSNSYAIRSDGSLWSWGDNTAGQLGDPTIATPTARSSPIQVGSTSWSLISASKAQNYVLATRNDNTLYGWGLNTNYQLGDSTTISRSSPVQVSGGGSWTAVSAGSGHALAVKSDYNLYAWGLNNIGQTANNGTSISWTQVAVGRLGTLDSIFAIRSDGALFAWGNNAQGQLGFGDTISRSSPVQVGSSSWSKVAASANYSTFAIRSDGALFGWGFNNQGQLGLTNINAGGDTVNRSSPVQIGTSSWSLVASGTGHTVGITADGKLFTWGLNTAGVLGDSQSTTAGRSSPVQISAGTSWTSVTTGTYHNLAIQLGGSLWSWGQNARGQLGLTNLFAGGDTVNRSAPVQITAIAGSSWSFVAAGNESSYAITNFQLYTWGQNSLGELGSGSALLRSAPVQVGSSSWTYVGAGTRQGQNQGYAHGITSIGQLYGWGFNTSGQLGDGTIVTKSVPTLIGALQNWASVVGGVATNTSGGLFAWGNNTDGQLGQNTAGTNTSSPVAVGTSISTILSAPAIIGNSSWTSVSAGGSHSMAIRIDGGLFAWGLNNNGQLGLTNVVATGDTTNRSSPVQVGTSSWVSVNAGGSHTLASRYGDNQLFTWGFNTQGQLGSGVTAARSSPVQINAFSTTTTSALTFNGTTQYLSGPANAPVITTGLFTIEAWVNWNGTGTSPAVCGNEGWSVGNNAGFYLFLNSTGTISLGASAGVFNTQPVIYTSTNTVPASAWTHIAMTRDASNVVRTFINGTVDPTSTTITQSLNLQSGTTPIFHIGAVVRDGGIGQAFPGSISNIRIVPGVAVYTTSFTPPSSALTATQSAGTNIAAISGIPSNGYSVWFNGSNMHLTVPYNSIFDIPASTQWTLECWVFTSSTNLFVIANRNWPFGGSGPTWSFSLSSGVTPTWGIAGTGSATYTMATSTLSGTLGQWNHYAFTRDVNNDVRIFVNGQVGVTRNDSQAMTSASGDVYIGVSSNLASGYASGNISNLRIVKGQALYTGTFTPTTSPLTTTSQGATAANVGLLTCQSTTIIDNSIANAGVGFTITNVNTAIVTLAYSPFGTQATILAAQGAAVTSDNSINAYTLTNVATVTQASATPFVAPLNGPSSSAGSSTGAAIGSTGSLYVWGLGTSGQIGDNTIVSKSVIPTIGTFISTVEYSPLQVGSSSWSQVSAGDSHVVGVKLDNTVFAWGLNSSGQLGDLSIVSRSSPVQVGTVTNALTNANAYSLYYDSGISGVRNMTTTTSSDWALGTNWTIEFFLSPSTIPSSPNVKWIIYQVGTPGIRIFIDYNPLGTLGFQADGSTVRCQTTNSLPLATWTHVAFSSIAGTVVVYFNGVAQPLSTNAGNGSYNLTATDGITLFNRPTGGDINTNFNGYISNLRIVKGTGVYTSAFTAPTTPLTAITNTVLLMAQNTTITTDNSGTSKVLTVNGTTPTYSLSTPFPSAIASGALFATRISAGATHSVAIDSSNKLYGWGYNTAGQLGISDTNYRSAPTQIGFLSNWTTISAGTDHTLALDSAGTLYAWGEGTTGQLGDITAVAKSSPVLITSISMPNTSSPTQIGTSSYTLISAGNNFSTAISSGKKLFVWGLGAQGQLGAGLTVARSRPTQISVSNSYNLIGAGGTHLSLVPSTSPQLILTTGLNTSGQLGSLTVTTRSSPVQISASASSTNSPVTVSAGNYSSYYVSSPTQVGSSSWTSVSAGGTHTLGIKYNNTLWAWGYNANGQLADSTTINRSSPVQIGSSSWSQVSAGDSHNIIAKSDGTINTFGLNSFGQLGDGT